MMVWDFMMFYQLLNSIYKSHYCSIEYIIGSLLVFVNITLTGSTYCFTVPRSFLNMITTVPAAYIPVVPACARLH